MEEARKRNISSIDKQLVKILHPDLEQDIEIKVEKEALMKQLTVAYQKGDLPTLLRFEMQWIHKENNHLDTLSEDQLALYNHLLKEQIHELKEEQYQLVHHPKYSSLQGFADGFSLPNLRMLFVERNTMEETTISLRQSIQRLESDNFLTELKDIIRIFKNQKQFVTRINLREFLNDAAL